MGAEEKIINLEYKLFMEIRDKVKAQIEKIQKTSKTIALIDMLTALSKVAEENGYIKPKLVNNR